MHIAEKLRMLTFSWVFDLRPLFFLWSLSLSFHELLIARFLHCGRVTPASLNGVLDGVARNPLSQLRAARVTRARKFPELDARAGWGLRELRTRLARPPRRLFELSSEGWGLVAAGPVTVGTPPRARSRVGPATPHGATRRR